MSWRRLENVSKTSWRRLENVWKASWRRIAWRNILVLTKTSWRRLEEVFWRHKAKVNIFVLIKTSWRRLEDVSWRRRRKTSSSRRMFAGVSHSCIRIVRIDYKINFTNKLKANLWIHLDLAKVHRLKWLTSPHIVFYLHFLNLNNIMTLPKLLSSLRLGLVWRDLCFPRFLPARLWCMRVSSRNQNKCKPSTQHT